MASSALSAFSAGVDLYAILNVARRAARADVVRAYRDLACEHHPDKQGDAEAMKLLNLAYEVLRDEEQRAEYDDYLLAAQERAAPVEGLVARAARVARAAFNAPALRMFSMAEATSTPPPRVDRLSNTIWVSLEHVQNGVVVATPGSPAPVAVAPGALNGSRIRTASATYVVKNRPHPVFRRGGTAVDPGTRPCDLVLEVDGGAAAAQPQRGDETLGVVTDLCGRRWIWRTRSATARVPRAGLPAAVSRFSGDIVVALVGTQPTPLIAGRSRRI